MSARPFRLYGRTHKVAQPYGDLWVTVNWSDGRIYEVFVTGEKTGTHSHVDQMEALGRAISIGLQNGVPVETFIKHFKGIRSGESVWQDGHEILSLADGVGQVLETEIKMGEPKE